MSHSQRVTDDALLDPLLLVPFTVHRSTLPASAPFLLKLRLSEHHSARPSDPALTVAVATFSTIHCERLLWRYLVKRVRAAIDASGRSLGKLRADLGLGGGMISNEGLQAIVGELMKRFVVEVNEGRADVVRAVDEVGQHNLSITSPALNLTLSFALEEVSELSARTALERHLFTPFLAVRNALDSLPSHATRAKLDQRREGGPSLEQAVADSARLHREGMGDYAALEDWRLRAGMVRWCVFAYAISGEDLTKLPTLERAATEPHAGPSHGAPPESESLTTTIEPSSDSIEESQLFPPPPPRPRRGQSRPRPSSDVGRRMLDHDGPAQKGERISFDETQQLSAPTSPRKRRRSIEGNERLGTGLGKGRGKKIVLVIDSDGEEDDVQVVEPREVEESEPGTESEPESELNVDDDEPDTEDEDAVSAPTAAVLSRARPHASESEPTTSSAVRPLAPTTPAPFRPMPTTAADPASESSAATRLIAVASPPALAPPAGSPPAEKRAVRPAGMSEEAWRRQQARQRRAKAQKK